jgi:hypothetical protein
MARDLLKKRRERFLEYLRHLPPDAEAELARLKKRGVSRRKNPDFIWHGLLSAMSTLGNARGHVGLIENKANYDKVTHEALGALSPTARLRRLESVLLDAKVRMPFQKARWLAADHSLVTAMGGSRAATKLARSQAGRNAKLRFMKQFVGIGEKYARDTWMAAYDPDFVDAIALDTRVLKVSKLLGFTAKAYDAHEQLYQELAREAGREPWEVDRLCYRRNEEIVRLLSGSGPGAAKRRPLDGPTPAGVKPRGRGCR